MDNYTCFYTSKPFWTGEIPDIASIKLNPDLFTKTLSEKTIKFENEYIYSSSVCNTQNGIYKQKKYLQISDNQQLITKNNILKRVQQKT
jgi:hypothetical protein